MKEHSKKIKHSEMPTNDPKYLLLTLTEQNIEEDSQTYEEANLSEDDTVVVSSLDNQLVITITDQILTDQPELYEAGIRAGDELQLVVPVNIASVEHPSKPPTRP